MSIAKFNSLDLASFSLFLFTTPHQKNALKYLSHSIRHFLWWSLIDRLILYMYRENAVIVVVKQHMMVWPYTSTLLNSKSHSLLGLSRIAVFVDSDTLSNQI